MRLVREARRAASVPLWENRPWAARFPWLVQGTTGRGEAEDPFDLGLSRDQPVGAVLDRWRALRRGSGMPGAVHARQVHGTDLAVHRGTPAPGLLVMEDVDGHVTEQPGLLLTVSVADCVPVFLIQAQRRAVALVHAGWRGTAAGIVERALEHLDARNGCGAIWLHCGPAICGRCYEVGPEVHAAVRPSAAPPTTPTPIDLRAAIAERARQAGVPPDQISVSKHCTRCGDDHFFSHRAGSGGRQMAILGVRPAA